MGFISCHLLLIASGVDTHTHIDNLHRVNFKKLGVPAEGWHAWFKNLIQNVKIGLVLRAQNTPLHIIPHISTSVQVIHVRQPH